MSILIICIIPFHWFYGSYVFVFVCRIINNYFKKYKIKKVNYRSTKYKSMKKCEFKRI